VIPDGNPSDPKSHLNQGFPAFGKAGKKVKKSEKKT